MLEHLRLAKMCFDLWGAISPTSLQSRQFFGDPAEQTLNPNSLDELVTNPEIYPSAADDYSSFSYEASSDEGQESARQETPSAGKGSLSRAEFESTLYKYDGAFADHLEMAMQMGYVILFSAAFPPAALCAMVYNFLEIRCDAFKLVYVCQRPFGERVPNIGTWQTCMECLSVVAVLVNCALIALSGQVHRMFPDMTTTQTILLIVALEHIMLVICFLVTRAIPDIPDWLATEMAKIEWARREATKYTSRMTAASYEAATPSKITVDFPESTNSPEQSMDTLLELVDNDLNRPLKESGRLSVAATNESLLSATNKDLQRLLSLRETENSKQHSVIPSSHKPDQMSQASSAKHKLTITADSIQEIPPFKPKKSKGDTNENRTTNVLAIGASGGTEWDKEEWQENNEHEDISSSNFAANDYCRSVECITMKLQEVSNSDPDFLKGNMVWPSMTRMSTPQPPPPPSNLVTAALKARLISDEAPAAQSLETLADSTRNLTTQDNDDQTRAALEAKKSRVKQSLIKRARSVAIFSLKLKERRAREAQEKAAKDRSSPGSTPLPPPQCGGGELSCIPIEKLIQLDDLRGNQSSSVRTTQTTSGTLNPTGAIAAFTALTVTPLAVSAVTSNTSGTSKNQHNN